MHASLKASQSVPKPAGTNDSVSHSSHFSSALLASNLRCWSILSIDGVVSATRRAKTPPVETTTADRRPQRDFVTRPKSAYKSIHVDFTFTECKVLTLSPSSRSLFHHQKNPREEVGLFVNLLSILERQQHRYTSIDVHSTQTASAPRD
jgi:hypothetical protein